MVPQGIVMVHQGVSLNANGLLNAELLKTGGIVGKQAKASR